MTLHPKPERAGRESSVGSKCPDSPGTEWSATWSKARASNSIFSGSGQLESFPPQEGTGLDKMTLQFQCLQLAHATYCPFDLLLLKVQCLPSLCKSVVFKADP